MDDAAEAEADLPAGGTRFEVFQRDAVEELAERTCPVCHKECKNKVGRVAHERTHEVRVPCPNGCGHAPLTRSGVTRHLRTCGRPAAPVVTVGELVAEAQEPDGPDAWRRRVAAPGLEVEVSIVAADSDLLSMPGPHRRAIVALLAAMDLIAAMAPKAEPDAG